jgi:hypothetical protein
MLFVDDRTRRIHSALRQYSDVYEVTIATNVKEALRALAREEWDVVSLDHDLTGIDFEDPDTSTCGMEIVRYIEKTGWPDHLLRKPKIFIHTSNLFAAHLMTIRLQALGFMVRQFRFQYDDEVENMKYDEKGLPV